MRLGGALFAGVAAFLAVAYLTGHAERLSLRLPGARRRPRDRALWLRQAGVRVTPAQFYAVSAALGLLAALVVDAATGSGAVAAFFAAVAAFAPSAYFGRQRERRQRELAAAWPDGIRHLVAATAARGTVHQAVLDLRASGPGRLREAFARYPAWARMAGPTAALEAVREELADPTTDRVVEVLVVAHERGGAVALRVLRELARSITEDLRALDETETAALEPKLNARIVFFLPWVVLFLLCLPEGGYRDFYAGPGGTLVVLLGAAMSLGGMAAVRRLGRLPTERRVLAAACAPLERARPCPT